MEYIENKRKLERLSQRELAYESGVSFRTIQLLEWGRHDPRLSTLKKVARGLHLPKGLDKCIARFFELSSDSITAVSLNILNEGEGSWPGWLFNFVDAFWRKPDQELIRTAPDPGLSPKLAALSASTVEALCAEAKLATPDWCEAVPSLKQPWFVSEMESLKASALAESPACFRKRNIFVFGNFLERK